MKMKMTLPIAIVSAAVLLAAGPVWAHHSMIAQFSLNRPITLKGTLTKMTWVNPHGWIYVDVAGSEGQVEGWAIETGSPLNMAKRGLTKRDFRPGTEIIVGGFAAKDGTHTVAGMIVTFPDREPSGREASFALGR